MREERLREDGRRNRREASTALASDHSSMPADEYPHPRLQETERRALKWEGEERRRQQICGASHVCGIISESRYCTLVNV